MNASCGNPSCIEAGVDRHQASSGKCQSTGMRVQAQYAEDPMMGIAKEQFKAYVQKPVRWRVRPFGSWRWNEIGIGFSLSFDQLEWSGLWIPDVWLHVGPLVIGLEVVFS